jgi:hypothetical protein
MDPVHFPQELFISCEDRLPVVSGLHNAVSALSGLAIMAHPVQSYLVARATLPSQVVASHDAALYFAAQFLLFYLNLHQHARGYVTLDLESGGSLHSIFLAQFLHNHPLPSGAVSAAKSHEDSSHTSYSRSWTLPKPLVAVVTWAAALRLLCACIVEPQRQTALASAVGKPFALYVISTMGSRSYRILRRRNVRRPFRLWIAACLSLVASQALVVFERNVVCPLESASAGGGGGGGAPRALWLSRSFHAVVIHAAIVALFYSVSECAIELVRESATGSAPQAPLEKKAS